jgi:DNA-binding GntR family transcriptional regulator
MFNTGGQEASFSASETVSSLLILCQPSDTIPLLVLDTTLKNESLVEDSMEGEGEAKPRGVARGMSQEVAFAQLRNLIVMGNLAPGSWVVEADLADRLGLSRTPIRGALQLLQNEGYAIEHRSGTKTRILIAPLTMEDARELYGIVGKLEGLTSVGLSKLAGPVVKTLTAELTRVNLEIQELATQGQGNARKIFELDSVFHRTLIEAAAGPRLLHLHRSIKPQIERYWRLYASAILNEIHFTVEEHSAIIEAVRSGDARAIETAIDANWVLGFERNARLIELFGERGSW